MEIDFEKLAQAATSGFDLSQFKGDVVGVKIVENEIGNIEAGGIGVQNVYNGQEQPGNQPAQMPPYTTREEVMNLYRFLIKEEFIESSTSAESFLYIMGVTEVPPKNLKLINWKGNMQQLRVMLTECYREPLDRKAIKLADIERLAPQCFLNKGNKMSTLAKPKEEPNLRTDALRNFFRPKTEL